MVTGNKKGYSLIELVVSMVLVSIVISNVYFFWNFMDKHIFRHSEQALLQKENDRIIHLVTSAVRQASSILYYNKNSILMTGGSDEDTISFSFSNDTLYKNKIPLTILMKRAYVKNFEIQDLSEDPLSKSPYLFLEFALTMASRAENESEARLTVKAKRPLLEYDPTIGW